VASVIGSLLENIDDQRSIVTWADIVIFQDEWTKLELSSTGLLPCWKVTKLIERLDVRGSILVAARQESPPLSKDRPSQKALLAYLAARTRAAVPLKPFVPHHSGGNGANSSVPVLLSDPPRGKLLGLLGLLGSGKAVFGKISKQTPGPALSDNAPGNMGLRVHYVSYSDLLHELVARYAFPDAVEWAQQIEARTQMHKNVSEVVALEVHRLVSAVNVMRLALKAAGRTEILQEGQTPPTTSRLTPNIKTAGPFSGVLLAHVHRIEGFSDFAGFMDRTDPYVTLQLGSDIQKTSVKDNVLCLSFILICMRLCNLLHNCHVPCQLTHENILGRG
jgi:hypothetical protein